MPNVKRLLNFSLETSFLTYVFFQRRENWAYPNRNPAYDLYKLKDKVKMLDKY